jgi:Rha family phage regulatory protein
MNTQPILALHDGVPMADSRDVAATFGKEHKRVLQTIREVHCSDGFRRHNFVPFKIKDLTGESTSHVLMTKNGFAFLVLGFTGAAAAVFKEAYIERFDAMEAQLRRQSGPVVPQSLPEALRLAADLAEQVATQKAEIAVLAPRSEALAVISDADGSLCVTDAAKALQMPPGELWAYLLSAQWIYRREKDGHPVAYQSKLTAGYLEHKVVPIPTAPGKTWARQQVRITPKGLTALAQRIPLDRPGGLFGRLTAPASA